MPECISVVLAQRCLGMPREAAFPKYCIWQTHTDFGAVDWVMSYYLFYASPSPRPKDLMREISIVLLPTLLKLDVKL